MNSLVELVQKAHEKKALSDAMWCYQALPNVTGLWRKHVEATIDRKSTRLNSGHIPLSRMPSSA